MRRFIAVSFCFLFVTLYSAAQNYYVDNTGVLRDDKGNESVFFGFNYCVPFAHGYRMHEGVDRKAAICQDVEHISRLGANAYRVHVWDVEISDREGNLLENEHLNLLDYTIAQFNKKGVRTMVTAIAFWGNGWPERDDKTLPGFSNAVTKQEATIDKDCVAAQQRYLRALMDHRNPYTGYCYKEDPAIVAIELNNEPDHTAKVSDKVVTEYINGLAKAVRAAGCRKPIVYNIAQNPDRAQAVEVSKINGVSCQWYPSGLVGGKARRENFLPAVAHYNFPFEAKGKARFIYEFDAADIDGSYMYPAMARAFREAGFQWATQFAYDPLLIAPYNTDYQTHYVNLLYTPAKAVSLRIAAEAFRTIPRGTAYGNYPMSNKFQDFNVDYNRDLSCLNRDTLFCYSNTTCTKPKQRDSIRHIVGHGCSSVVQYTGTGIYFLDKEGDSWLVEVYPDVVRTDNAYARRNSKEHPVALIQSNEQTMRVALPGCNVKVRLFPGVYVIKNNQVVCKKRFDYPNGAMTTQVYHEVPEEIIADSCNRISACVVSPTAIDSVVFYGEMMYGARFKKRMNRSIGCEYAAKICVPKGILNYYITVYQEGKPLTYPERCAIEPNQWDFYARKSYTCPIVTDETPCVLYSSDKGNLPVELSWKPGVRFAYYPEGMLLDGADVKYGGNASMNMDVCSDRVFTHISLEATPIAKNGAVRIELIDSDGYCWSMRTELGEGAVKIPLVAFRPVQTMPQREIYPGFSFSGNIQSSQSIISSQKIVSVRIMVEEGSSLVVHKCALIMDQCYQMQKIYLKNASPLFIYSDFI